MFSKLLGNLGYLRKSKQNIKSSFLTGTRTSVNKEEKKVYTKFIIS